MPENWFLCGPWSFCAGQSNPLGTESNDEGVGPAAWEPLRTGPGIVKENCSGLVGPRLNQGEIVSARRSTGDDILVVVRVGHHAEEWLPASHDAGEHRDEELVREIPFQEGLGEFGTSAQDDILPRQ